MDKPVHVHVCEVAFERYRNLQQQLLIAALPAEVTHSNIIAVTYSSSYLWQELLITAITYSSTAFQPQIPLNLIMSGVICVRYFQKSGEEWEVFNGSTPTQKFEVTLR